MPAPANANTPIGWEDVVRACDHQLSAQLGEDVVVLELDAGIYFGLNATGAFIWEMLAQPTAVAAIPQRISDEFEVDDATARDDLISLLRRLHQAGLVEICTPADPRPIA